MSHDHAQLGLFRALPSPSGGTEEFSLDAASGKIIRRIRRRDQSVSTSSVPAKLALAPETDDDPQNLHDQAWLRQTRRISTDHPNDALRVVDLFSGCGGLSLGIAEACRALEIGFKPVLALDFDSDALSLFERNFNPTLAFAASAESLIDGEIGAPTTVSENQLLAGLEPPDLLVGGPPCQGHSDLNNRTRRADRRNALILRMVRLAELARPAHVIIENVPGSAHDRTGSVPLAIRLLSGLGYHVSTGLVQASEVGVAQRRRRFFVVGSLRTKVALGAIKHAFRTSPRTFDWACGDLETVDGSVFDSSARHSQTNQRRIEYLHERGLYELPDAMRPDCHRLKAHDYDSVYGRMYADRPSPTITTGFGSTGQGRFVHPRRPRTLTPHEAARLQYFPDFFDFGGIGRRALQKVIGNAVPSRLGYVLGIELLR
jgi:DNA (cytosine-5)-methyltransferase 1